MSGLNSPSSDFVFEEIDPTQIYITPLSVIDVNTIPDQATLPTQEFQSTYPTIRLSSFEGEMVDFTEPIRSQSFQFTLSDDDDDDSRELQLGDFDFGAQVFGQSEEFYNDDELLSTIDSLEAMVFKEREDFYGPNRNSSILSDRNKASTILYFGSDTETETQDDYTNIQIVSDSGLNSVVDEDSESYDLESYNPDVMDYEDESVQRSFKYRGFILPSTVRPERNVNINQDELDSERLRLKYQNLVVPTRATNEISLAEKYKDLVIPVPSKIIDTTAEKYKNLVIPPIRLSNKRKRGNIIRNPTIEELQTKRVDITLDTHSSAMILIPSLDFDSSNIFALNSNVNPVLFSKAFESTFLEYFDYNAFLRGSERFVNFSGSNIISVYNQLLLLPDSDTRNKFI